MQKELPDKNIFIGMTLPTMDDYVIQEWINSGHNAHVFRAHSSILNHDLACKIIPKVNLTVNNNGDATWNVEAQKANTLSNPIVVKCNHHLPWLDNKLGIDCFVLIYDYVKGKNLADYIKEDRKEISTKFILDFLKAMLNLLFEMKSKNIKHGDMHSRNILVESPDESQMQPEPRFRVTDFAAWTASGDHRIRDDYEQLAITLRELLNCVDYSKDGAISQDKFIFNFLDTQFGKYLIEDDPTRSPLARQPKLLHEKLANLGKEYKELEADTLTAKLVSPFDGLSCEQISKASTLKALYSDKFLALDMIQHRNNLVLTGPRGCGKSTVFKSLSLRHRTLVHDDKPEHVEYVGIYYNCNSDLLFAFPRYRLPENSSAYDLPLHYITATLLIDVLETINVWATHHYEKIFIEAEQRVAKMLWEVLAIKPPQQPNANSFMTIIACLANERRNVAGKYRLADIPEYSKDKSFFNPSVLLRFCQTLKDEFSFLSNRPFYFFIDDYSAPKITKELQKILNCLFMQRHASCFFKLSTESPVSYACEDIDGKNYVEGREFEYVNLGVTYLQEDDNRTLMFIDDVFLRRFKHFDGYPVKDLDSLIGNERINNNQMARDIRDKGKVELYGKETLRNLCSGDIHYIITLVAHMVDAVGGQAGLNEISTTPKITPKKQNEVIRNEAGSFLNSLKATRDGDKLVKIVTAFANVANFYLKSKVSKNEESSPPWQASRIEPLEELNWSDNAQVLYNNLLRYSVFLLDTRGKSRRGIVGPRLYLRRCLIPLFNLTFSKRDSVSLNTKQLEKLLLQPDDFEKEMKSIKSDDGQGGGQMDFFKVQSDE